MKTKELVFCAVFVALVAISSMITIPIGPVPITLQTPMVILTGALLGRRLGGITMVVYLIAGLIGAPVFAGGERKSTRLNSSHGSRSCAALCLEQQRK